MITEDIDISWKLQLNQWTIFYEPRALCWILMPETLKGLWKQRLRWAQGGAEVFLKNMTRLWRKENFRMWPLFFEYCLTTIWAFTCLVGFIIYAVQLAGVPLNIELTHIAATHTAGILLCTLCLLQFIVSLMTESPYHLRIRIRRRSKEEFPIRISEMITVHRDYIVGGNCCPFPFFNI